MQKQILVIDDDEFMRDAIKASLEQEGYQVTCMTNGKSGVKRFQEAHFDVVVTDIFMPEKDGIETIMELKRLKKDVKILAISGEGNYVAGASLLKQAQLLGASFTLHKPILPEELNEKIKILLNEPSSD